ncbi:MAG: class I SAM-dependent methyltransferase [Ignavibacteriaceae bacterium]|jgi:hypothetical protein|nr:class I SAM-dependent methyltransferase [Ignavibacteriaceae bacterium]
MNSFGTEFWNERYSKEGFVYGTEPNEFFKETLTNYTNEKIKTGSNSFNDNNTKEPEPLDSGNTENNLKTVRVDYKNSSDEEFQNENVTHYNGLKILLPADGEARNGVFAATLGWDVTSVDQSSTAKEKALKLAAEKNVNINYQIGDLTEMTFPDNNYDAIGLIFFHLPEENRQLIHKKMINTLKPGGIIILEAYEKDQLGRDSGGPQDLDVLYSLEDIITDFIDLDIKIFSKEIVTLNEGAHHSGEAAVIRLVGIKV